MLSEPAQGWLLNETAFCLRAVGRLTEAVEPMQTSVSMAVQRKDWRNAAAGAANLSELELTLGEVPGAVSNTWSSPTVGAMRFGR